MAAQLEAELGSKSCLSDLVYSLCLPGLPKELVAFPFLEMYQWNRDINHLRKAKHDTLSWVGYFYHIIINPFTYCSITCG